MSSTPTLCASGALIALFALGGCGGASESPAPEPAAAPVTETASTETDSGSAETASSAAQSEAVQTAPPAAEPEPAAAEAEPPAVIPASAPAAAAEEEEPAAAEAEAAEEPAPAATGGGAEIVVQMYNANPDDPRQRMVFLPRIIQIQPGDTVTWEPTDLSHQSASIRGMIPDGAEPWNSQINKPVSVTFDQPGIYGYQCVPHYSAGMVGLVIVEGEGKLDNLEAAKAVRQPGLAKRAFDEIWQEAEDAGYLSE